MKKSKALFFVYTFLLFLCAYLVWGAAQNLPPVVATHFDLSGTPDATMPRDLFTNLFIVFMVLTSGLIALLPLMISQLPPQLINIPNRSYWLAHDQIEITKQILQAYLLIFASLLCCFMAVIFWLIVQANLLNPPKLSTQYVTIVTSVFVVLTIFWSMRLYARFKKY